MEPFERPILLPETEDCLRSELAILLANARPARNRDVRQDDSNTAEEHFDPKDELNSQFYNASRHEDSHVKDSEEWSGDEGSDDNEEDNEVSEDNGEDDEVSEDNEEDDGVAGLQYRERDENDEGDCKNTSTNSSKTCHLRWRQRWLPRPQRHKILPRSDPALYQVMPYSFLSPRNATLQADSTIRASIECGSSSELTLAPLGDELPAETIFFGKCTVQPIEPPMLSNALLPAMFPQQSTMDSHFEHGEENERQLPRSGGCAVQKWLNVDDEIADGLCEM